MNFYLTAQHTTQYVRIVMKHTLTMAAEVLTVLLIFITGALLLAL
jgi:hypothetical protein